MIMQGDSNDKLTDIKVRNPNNKEPNKQKSRQQSSFINKTLPLSLKNSPMGAGLGKQRHLEIVVPDDDNDD